MAESPGPEYHEMMEGLQVEHGPSLKKLSGDSWVQQSGGIEVGDTIMLHGQPHEVLEISEGSGFTVKAFKEEDEKLSLKLNCPDAGKGVEAGWPPHPLGGSLAEKLKALHPLPDEPGEALEMLSSKMGSKKLVDQALHFIEKGIAEQKLTGADLELPGFSITEPPEFSLQHLSKKKFVALATENEGSAGQVYLMNGPIGTFWRYKFWDGRIGFFRVTDSKGGMLLTTEQNTESDDVSYSHGLVAHTNFEASDFFSLYAEAKEGTYCTAADLLGLMWGVYDDDTPGPHFNYAKGGIVKKGPGAKKLGEIAAGTDHDAIHPKPLIVPHVDEDVLFPSGAEVEQAKHDLHFYDKDGLAQEFPEKISKAQMAEEGISLLKKAGVGFMSISTSVEASHMGLSASLDIVIHDIEVANAMLKEIHE